MRPEKRTKIAFLGGDMRTSIAVAHLAEKNTDIDILTWRVPDCEFLENAVVCDNMYRAITDADAVILPLPASSDGITLNYANENNEIKTTLSLIADAVSENCIIIGGKLPRAFVDYASAKGLKCFDYFESEAFQIKNAYTTAEAALSIAMNNLKKNIKDAHIAVTGYGRIAKQLVRLLRALNVKVTLLARKDSDMAYAELEGCNTMRICGAEDEMLKISSGYDVIFNTVPNWLFNENFLKAMDKKTLLIDLASAPGGVDISQAKRLHSNVLWATSLPGKYAPESAGELIYICISELIKKEVCL